jgi:hypothetical protein
MDCEFTQEVSLLVDGELEPHEAARLRAHAESCAACRQAREAFLLLRQQLRSYERAPDPHAQSRALAAILDYRASAGEAAATSAGTRGRRFPSPRETARGSWGRLKETSHALRLRPAHVATLALLLIATALGLRWLAGSYTSPVARQSVAPASANKNDRPADASGAVATSAKESQDLGEPITLEAKTQGPPRHAGAQPQPTTREWREAARVRRDSRRPRDESREDLRRDSRLEVARVDSHTLPSSPTNAAAGDKAGGRLTTMADAESRIGLHAERVERLLRSFRNARLSDADPALDVADARRLSKRLLYSNIALRREAAGAGDLLAEGWLDSLEPVLLDISNLPDKPSPDAVGSIKERIRRRQLVGVLQAQAMLASNR